MWLRSIGFRLIVSVGAIAILVIGTFVYANITSQREQLLQEKIRNVHAVSEVIRRSLRYDMLQYQPERLHAAIDTIGAQEGIEKVRIFNAQGEIIYSSHKAEMGTLLDKRAEQCYVCHAKEKPFERLTTSARTRIFRAAGGHRVLGMINPIYNEPDCFSADCHVHQQEQKVLGVLDIDMGIQEVDASLERNKQKMVLFAAVAILSISGIIALVIQRLVNRPVGRLLEGTERVTEGDLETPIAVSGRDELSILARSFNNMTERLQASENELRASEEKYRSLFENDPNPIFVLDVETFQILDVNIRATETYGYSREEFGRMSFLGLGGVKEADRIRSLAVAGCVFLPKILHRKKDGTTLYVNIHSCPRLHLGRDVIIANIADITHRIEVEAQLVQAGKMATLGEMSAGIAHELNQPLNAIRIGCDYFGKMLAKGERIPDEVLGRVGAEIVSQVERASRIINHLREFGRKSDEDEMELVEINDPIKGVFTLLGQQLKLKQIETELDLAEDLPPVLGSPNRLEQVFLNLVMNARDAIEEKRAASGGAADHSRVAIHSFRDGDRVVVTVSDSGAGVPEAIRDRIFEPFFTSKEVGKGTGLGLSISYGIIKDCGGDIEMESQEGAGTTFKLSFPAWSQERDASHGEDPDH